MGIDMELNIPMDIYIMNYIQPIKQDEIHPCKDCLTQCEC